jgi:hypothetical protein
MVNKALLVGINYINTPYELNGCINDTTLVKNRLTSDLHFKEENIVCLRDDQPNKMPTFGKILEELSNIINNSNENDNIYIHFSGHGTYVEDTNNDEKDGKDEVFVPINYNEGLISDDLLFSIISKTKCKTLLVFDCCHSGSICDLPYRYDSVNHELKLNVENERALNKHITMISGCRDEQSSFDYYNDEEKNFHGLLTIKLMNYVKENSYSTTFKDLISNIHKLTNLGENASQNPNVSASFKDFLNERVFNTEEYLKQEQQQHEQQQQEQQEQQQIDQELQKQKKVIEELKEINKNLVNTINSKDIQLINLNNKINELNDYIKRANNYIVYLKKYINYIVRRIRYGN